VPVDPALLTALFAVAFAVGAGFASRESRRTAQWRARAVRARGTVVAHEVDDALAEMAVVDFVTVDGRRVQGTERDARRPMTPARSWARRRGEVVTLVYDPQQPERILVDGGGKAAPSWLVAGLLGIGSVAALGATVVLLVT
jgi:hypothetical protein